ncbi:unnamed protein product [Caenorhabditis auriculariae]|uniref:Uncharacterized protein n=1 Tax=Caenorhabditis auriculariae TaxID=2777116 RepID=A0A8S1HKQ0_9PELO|nr:unnamed protein product [Caenorhabditis auriculariae]
MTESSPEPLDDVDPEMRSTRRVVRWSSMREETRDANGLRRNVTLPGMSRRGRRLRNGADEDVHSFSGHSFLRVPGISGRNSPSVASMSSEPESCIDDVRFINDEDDVDIVRTKRMNVS